MVSLVVSMSASYLPTVKLLKRSQNIFFFFAKHTSQCVPGLPDVFLHTKYTNLVYFMYSRLLFYGHLMYFTANM
jgi:hypothetical protein